MRCAACSVEVPEAAHFCDACGAAVYQRAAQPAADAADSGAGTPAGRAGPRGRGWLWLGVPAAGLAVAAGAAGLMAPPLPEVTAETLAAAVRHAGSRGDGPGRDPVCVANGLAYDSQPVNVQAGNAGTLAWMDTLVAAGLYAPAEDGDSGGSLSQPIRIYRPQAALAAWNGARRLCAAQSVKLDAVRNVGTVQPMRLRGEAYPGVAADLVWTLDGPAPWLDAPGVAAAFSSELPAWRGARWEVTPHGWQLIQRRHFFLSGTKWLTGESLERLAGAAAPQALAP